MRIFVCLASPWSCVLILLLCAAWLHWLQCIWRVHCPPVTTRHPAGIIWCPDSDHWSSAPQDVLCWYFIPHFTSSDFTMHKQSEFMMRSLVMHCPLHQNQAGHSSGLQSWHSCGTLLDGSVPMNESELLVDSSYWVFPNNLTNHHWLMIHGFAAPTSIRTSDMILTSETPRNENETWIKGHLLVWVL